MFTSMYFPMFEANYGADNHSISHTHVIFCVVNNENVYSGRIEGYRLQQRELPSRNDYLSDDAVCTLVVVPSRPKHCRLDLSNAHRESRLYSTFRRYSRAWAQDGRLGRQVRTCSPYRFDECLSSHGCHQDEEVSRDRSRLSGCSRSRRHAHGPNYKLFGHRLVCGRL